MSSVGAEIGSVAPGAMNMHNGSPYLALSIGYEPIRMSMTALGTETEFVTMAPSSVKRWFVLRTRSRQEKALAEDLDARRIEHFLPLAWTVRYHGRRKVRVQLPLFSGYLFLFGWTEDAFAADRSGRVAQILAVNDQERLEADLQNIRKAISTGAPLEPCMHIERGMLVEVTAGPFKGLRGCVEQGLRYNRFVLGVELIGRAAAFEIDRDLLRVLD